ncbi:hypothetical protein SS05631_a47060 (plasmid) [Sinorhizobium sp. CCBAU 05631]|nr:hypothetical protein SS05631_a47060 [Sinorhizobium sp. CCBAU 05631]
MLIGRLHSDRTHGRPHRSFCNSLGIGSIALLALDESFYIDRRDQPNVMAEPCQLAPPIMGCAASLHRDYKGTVPA